MLGLGMNVKAEVNSDKHTVKCLNKTNAFLVVACSDFIVH